MEQRTPATIRTTIEGATIEGATIEGPAIGGPRREADRARLEALIDLLGDESPVVFASVRDELLRAGPAVLPRLRRAAESDDSRRRPRARRILIERERSTVMRRLLRYAARGSVDLEQALMLLSRIERADFDARPYRRALDAFAAEVSKRLARERDALARPMVLVHYLGEELGFTGARDDYHHPDNVYLHRAIERKSGMPLTLAAVYMLVARRVGLRAAALPLPGHVLLRLYTDDSAMIVDPFDGGRLCTQEACLSYLARQGLKPQPSWFRDAGDDQLFQRHVMNLMHGFRLRGLDRAAHELYRLALVLDDVRRRGS